MYLHIGEDILVHTDEIVAILDKKLLDSSPIFAEFLQQKADQQLDLTRKSIKSIVVTTKHVYYSSLASVTLKKRSQQHSIVVEE
jgi:extracellular matrix regulatory protein B